MTGARIIIALRNMNRWLDDFLIELCRPLLMLLLICATVALFTGGHLALAPWFNVAWAILQAVAIDGLFFAVWAKIRRAHGKERLALIPIGLVLALVAFLINDI